MVRRSARVGRDGVTVSPHGACGARRAARSRARRTSGVQPRDRCSRGMRARERARHGAPASRPGGGGAPGSGRPRSPRRARSRTRRGGGSEPGPTTALVTITTPRRRRRPRASARNVARSRIGQIRPTGGSGPWTGGGAARRDRPSCSSASGSRASCSACGCSVGTSSSRMASSNARAATRWGPGAQRRILDAGARTAGESTGRPLPSTIHPPRKVPAAASHPSRSGKCLVRSIACCVVHSADMVRDPGVPGDPVLGTSPANGSTDRARQTPRTVLLHICGHACGQPWGAATVGTPAADDLWAKVSAAVRGAVVRGDLEHLVPGGARPRTDRRDADPGRSQLGHDRAPPHQLPRSAQRRGPGPHRRSARGLADRRHHTPPRGAGDARLADPATGRRRRCRRDAPGRRIPHGHGLAHHVRAESPLHVRPVRHRRLQPLRPRGRDVRGREPGPVVQPAVHLRPRRTGQDPPAARDRPPRARALLEQACPVRLDRDDDERVRRRDALEAHAGLQAPLPRASTCSSSTTSSSSNAPSNSRKSSSTRSTTSMAAAVRS